MTTIEQRATQAGAELRQVAAERADAMGDAQQVVTAARWRVRRQVAVAGIGLLVAVAAVGSVLPRFGLVVDPVGRSATGWTGATVELPAGWQVASETLMPNGPREQFAASTAGLLPDGDRCAQVPEAALEQIGPTDALVMAQRLNPAAPDDPVTGTLRAFPDDALNRGVLRDCPSNGDRLDIYQFGVRLDGDGYWVLAAFGAQASDQRRAEALSVLNSFQPGPPGDTPTLSVLDGPQTADDIIPKAIRDQIGLEGRWAATARLARQTDGYRYYAFRQEPSARGASPQTCLLVLPDDSQRWSAGCSVDNGTSGGAIVGVSNGDVDAGLVHDGITNTAQLDDPTEEAAPVENNVFVRDQ